MNWQRHPKVRFAAQAILRGGVVAYPTEAVWGLGCDPFDVVAVRHILTLKNRPMHKGLILVAADIQQFGFLLQDLSNQDYQRLAEGWPGHQTWLVPHNDRVPFWVCGDSSKVAIRVSQHPVVKALCSQVDSPIISTSANPAGRLPARESFKAQRYFGDQIMYCPGRVGKHNKPSQIRDLETNTLLRA